MKSMIIVNYPIKNNYIGICNFLKTMFSCYRINNIIHKNNKIPCVCSDIKHVYNSIFKDKSKVLITKNKIIPITFDEINNIYKDNKIYSLLDWKFYIISSDNINCNDFSNIWFNKNNKNSIDLKYQNIPYNIRKIYLKIINDFEINENILENVNNIINNTNKDFLGVHIRTWTTFLWGDKFPKKYIMKRYNYYLSVRKKYIELINNSKYNTVLICSDNYKEINKNIIPYISKNKEIILYQENNELNSFQNIFSELLLLSKSKYLIGTLNSTFSELAWWYSKCSIEVDIV